MEAKCQSKTICYSAIFKNESKNVYRCLDALKPLIDFVSICDTGSTDNTVELIKKWGKENSIPTKVHYGEEQVFKNFGYNRTLAYKKSIEDFPNADYLLLVDADMVVKINSGFKKNSLDLDSYLFEQVTPGIRYWNVRLISAKCEWECVGVTHEYWETKKQNSVTGKLLDIWIDDIGDGGSKEDKFKRDIRLLLEGINNSNTSDHLKGRYMFYLANSYKDSGQPEEAVKWYQSRIDAGGWVEEIFYSYLSKGRCYEKMKDHPNAVYTFLQAYEHRPSRAESLYELSKLFRGMGKNNAALIYSLQGQSIEYPTQDSLFIEHNVYNYLFLEEISICGFYCGTKNKEKGKACVIKLLSMKDKISESSYKLALSNAKYYGLSEDIIDKFKAAD